MSQEPAVLQSTDGRKLELPQEAFEALWDFIHGHRRSGSVTMQFKNGGVAGVNGCHIAVTTEMKYK